VEATSDWQLSGLAPGAATPAGADPLATQQIMQQMQSLLDEKSKLVQENDRLLRENNGLQVRTAALRSRAPYAPLAGNQMT
jgi:hypothetical protein